MDSVNKYSTGKIYRLWSTEVDDIYVGSTCAPLHKRLYWHREASNQKQYKLYEAMRDLGRDAFQIELIEDYPCETVYELHRREGHWIRLLKPTLNTQLAGRTKEEYNRQHYQDNREELLQKRRMYYVNHKDACIKYIQKYRQDNIERTKEYSQNYDKLNKETIEQRRGCKITCNICNAVVRRDSLLRHEKSKRHVSALS